MEISVNEVFRPCWEAKTRYVVMKGSAGSGKSWDTAQFYICRLLQDRKRSLLCIRKTAESNERSTFRELTKAIERMGVRGLFDITTRPMSIRLHGGGEILFGGVSDEAQRERLKSITASRGSITDVWIEEATELAQADFEIIDDRLRGILPEGLFYQIRLTFNPTSAGHWIKRVFFDTERADVTINESTYLDNAFCDKQYHERMMRRAETDPEGYRVYGRGEWGGGDSLIFTNYIIKEFDTDRAKFDHIRYGQDFGFNHANVLLSVGIKDGDIYVLDELYVRGMTTDQIIEKADRFDKNVRMWCDCAEPDRITMWRRAGWNAAGVRKRPVAFCNDWLKARKIFIHPHCAGTIDEISSWRYQRDKNGDVTDMPVPYHDDAMAALRYAVCEFMGKGTKPAPAPTIPRKINFACERTRGRDKIKII